MARISFEDYNNSLNKQHDNQNRSNVGYFGLRNDGDSAVVRIMVNSDEDINIMRVHNVEMLNRNGNRVFRKVNCLSSAASGSIANCPLCEAGVKATNRVFIPLIRYVKNESGQVEGVPEVWDAGGGTALQLHNYIMDYGPLSEMICKISRAGTGLQTTYNISPNLNPSIYNENTYKKVDNAFNDFDPLGRMVLNKSSEDLTVFLERGEFPERESENTTHEFKNPAITNPTFSVPDEDNEELPWDTNKPVRNNPADAQMPWNNNSRPTRTY